MNVRRDQAHHSSHQSKEVKRIMKKQKLASSRGTEPAQSSEQTQEKIRLRAYELYELRGRQDGGDFDDWLKAESEITSSTVR